MSLFDRFLRIVSSALPFGLSTKSTKLLLELDPNKIYVENVRSILGVSHGEAVRILETAVRQGAFKKMIEIQFPDGSVAASAEHEEELPAFVHCWREDDEGHLEEAEVESQSLRKNVFYRINERTGNTVQRTA
jgi:hypothetical protein